MAEVAEEIPAGDEAKAAEAAARRMIEDQRKARGRRRGRGEARRAASVEHGGACSGAEIFVSERRKRVHCAGREADGNNAGGGSVVSSTSASCGRCSPGSDHEALFSQLSLDLAGRDRRSGPDHFGKNRRPSVDSPTPRKSIDSNQDARAEDEEAKGEGLDPAKHSFSIALKECQNRRFRSESSSSPPEGTRGRGRASSLDLNAREIDASAGSSMKKAGAFPSPGTPNYQKGWSSERIPPPANSSRRYVSSSALLPFHNGRTLPSKWEDAEKWIFSPVPGNGRPAGLPPHHRRPKSKSGPLASPFEMGFSFSSASPPMPIFDGKKLRNFPEISPFLTGVLMAEERERGSSCSQGDDETVRSDQIAHSTPSLPCSGGSVDAPVILKKDVATQMSPDGSSRSSSSSKERPLSSLSLDSPPVIEETQKHSSKLEVRDVQVDDRVTVTRWTKKNVPRGSDKIPKNASEPKTKKKVKTVEASPEADKLTSKIKREEARITAWENLQKAKAEAAIRKLEMKLEKKRASSMERIWKKLKWAQKKAQEMRNALPSEQPSRTRPINSLWACFSCHCHVI